MKSRWNISVLFVLMLLGSVGPAGAQIVTREQAERVATNWITMVISLTGGWGGAPAAQVTDVIEFKRGDRVLGYYCPVNPTGQIVVSLIEGLAPVKEFSETDVFDPTLDEGPSDLLKLQMESLLTGIEKKLGPLAQIQPAGLDTVLALNHRPRWRELDIDPVMYRKQLPLLQPTDNYYKGQILLTSYWHQHDPYNRWCPPAGPGCGEANCTVGCVALAGAQIMRYWSWPPGRAWRDMPDTLQSTDPSWQIDPTAELCRAIGDAVGMTYCSHECASTSVTSDMEGVYEGWLYDLNCAVANRTDHTWEEWFALIKDELNQNRPIHYRILGHSIVCDGWWDVSSIPSYHMNYGWANSYNAWYTLDALHQPDPDGSWADEYMVLRIRPIGSMGPVAVGPQAGTIRYVDQDCLGSGVIYPAALLMQFLPGVELTCGAGYIMFQGRPGQYTRLYTVDTRRGIRLESGSMVLYTGGSMRFGRLRRP